MRITSTALLMTFARGGTRLWSLHVQRFEINAAWGPAMPARIVVVLRDPELADATVSALVADGHDALAVHDSMAALALLKQAMDIELLVASTYFGEGKPTGAALALMTKLRRPQLKVILTANPELVLLLEDIGRVIVEPKSPSIRITMTAEKSHSWDFKLTHYPERRDCSWHRLSLTEKAPVSANSAAAAQKQFRGYPSNVALHTA